MMKGRTKKNDFDAGFEISDEQEEDDKEEDDKEEDDKTDLSSMKKATNTKLKGKNEKWRDKDQAATGCRHIQKQHLIKR